MLSCPMNYIPTSSQEKSDPHPDTTLSQTNAEPDMQTQNDHTLINDTNQLTTIVAQPLKRPSSKHDCSRFNKNQPHPKTYLHIKDERYLIGRTTEDTLHELRITLPASSYLYQIYLHFHDVIKWLFCP
ncbi:hypothetical protein NPIL_622981 [Nephila pilipes]|uniref:Uncharacterized protein n=1 Tax=Nephila pilipes TaxID=299642 RepID=A0A8X6T8L1_NEPPI|nr:hypothetical protein NPIL_622981 [Nephila pilipes]